MTLRKRVVASVAAIATVALVATACGGSSGGDTGQGANSGQSKGGTLNMLNFRTYSHLDPQRAYLGIAISFLIRTMVTTLTTFPAEEGANATKLVAQGATDTGTSTNGAKTWSFTLRDGLKWEDGQDVTCADYKYGVSRTFAPDITAGPKYAIQYLDIPSNDDGTSQYGGPYAKTGQDLFDKAVTCSSDNKTITFNLKSPVADFNQTVTLPAFAAIRQDKDTGANYDFTPFSDGPYMLDGTWDKNTGGKLKRNPNWDESSDPVRKAYPDNITVSQGIASEEIAQRLIADAGDDQSAVTVTNVPPSQLAQAVSIDRQKNADNGFVDYLYINMSKQSNPMVRKAIGEAISKDSYITALGGKQLGDPATTMINRTLSAYKEYDAYGAGSGGNTDMAKSTLQSAGVSTPYPLTFAYPTSTTNDKWAAGFKSQLDAAGFSVTLNPLGDDYYDVAANPDQTPDVGWAGWGADWPSGSTVIPPLFDSRSNFVVENGKVTNTTNDYGQYSNDETNNSIDEALNLTDSDAQQKAWGDLDESIGKEYAFVPLTYDKAFVLYGSKVKGFVANGAFGGYVDLGVVAVQ